MNHCDHQAQKPEFWDGEGHEHSLEAYASAVRIYQDVVLELQDAVPEDSVAWEIILEKLEMAKQAVNYYRRAYKEGVGSSFQGR